MHSSCASRDGAMNPFQPTLLPAALALVRGKIVMQLVLHSCNVRCMTQSELARWLVLSLSLPSRPASTARVRLWRALRDLGVGSLRDGVSVLPATASAKAAFESLAGEVAAEDGTAWLLELPAQSTEVEQALAALFDRTEDYGELSTAMAKLSREIPALDEAGARRRLRQLDKTLAEVERLDFFPGTPQAQARAARAALAAELNRRFSPQEPAPTQGAIAPLVLADYRGRTWATRRHLWVDRVVSAWLIRWHIDPGARFLWLDRPAACPPDALGFDFDGAAFSHTSVQGTERVTFEVLLASFGLEANPGLARLGALVHYLDVGGLPVAEAAGLEAVLAGLRSSCADDDALLAAASPVLDALHLRLSMPDA
jgi:hypothetical protein